LEGELKKDQSEWIDATNAQFVKVTNKMDDFDKKIS